MNKAILIGRLTAEPEIRYSQGQGQDAMCIARYRLAVDRWGRKDGDQQSADFIGCVAFGRNAEFAEKYFHRGTKIAIVGRIQTGSYTNKDGQKVYTTDVVIETQEFAESKAAGGGAVEGQQSTPTPAAGSDEFMNIPNAIDEELPFA